MKCCHRCILAATMVLGAAGFPAAPARALHINTVLREVSVANPSLAARRSMVDAARARIGPAGAWPSPLLELGAINVPTRGGFDADPMTMKMIALSQRFPVSGRAGLARRAAGESVASEQAGERAAEFAAWGMAWEAYADAYYAGELATLADRHRATLDRFVESARARYQSGRSPLADLLLAQSEPPRLLTDLEGYRAEERAALARLNQARGIAPSGPVEILAPLPTVPLSPDPDVWVAAVRGSHPRLREIEARTGHYRLAARAARRSAWPDLEVRGSYGKRGALAGGVSQDDMYSVTVGLALPVLAPQRELAEGAEMEALSRASEAERRTAELELEQQVTAAHAAALAAERSAALLEDSVLVFQQRALDASWAAYAAGSIDLFRLLESAHSLYDENVALVRTRQAGARAAARLVALTGRTDLLGIPLPLDEEKSR